MGKANNTYYEEAKNNKRQAKKDKNKYKYAIIIYRQRPLKFISNILDYDTYIKKIIMFRNFDKFKSFNKLHYQFLYTCELNNNKIINGKFTENINFNN